MLTEASRMVTCLIDSNAYNPQIFNQCLIDVHIWIMEILDVSRKRMQTSINCIVLIPIEEFTLICWILKTKSGAGAEAGNRHTSHALLCAEVIGLS